MNNKMQVKFEWDDEKVIDFATVSTQGAYGIYKGCKTIESKLRMFIKDWESKSNEWLELSIQLEGLVGYDKCTETLCFITKGKTSKVENLNTLRVVVESFRINNSSNKPKFSEGDDYWAVETNPEGEVSVSMSCWDEQSEEINNPHVFTTLLESLTYIKENSHGTEEVVYYDFISANSIKIKI